MGIRKPKILLTGRPGVGKTTVVRTVVNALRGPAEGFYTDEIREGGKRQGFLIHTPSGESGILAHVRNKGPFRVGRYGVDVDLFDRVVASTLEMALDHDPAIIIDEIGKMELFSQRFRHVVERILESERKVLAVIHLRNDPFTQKIRLLPNLLQITVTERNRDALPSAILEKMELNTKSETVKD